MLHVAMALGAALMFTVGGIFMKPSEGLTRPWPTVAVLGLFTLGALLLTLSVAARGELGAAYLFVLGLETVLAFSFGMFIFGERATAGRILGLVLLLAGIDTDRARRLGRRVGRARRVRAAGLARHGVTTDLPSN